MSENSLSIVIPAYNEEENIADTLHNVQRGLQRAQIADYEIIVVDDGSADRTSQIVESLKQQIPHVHLIRNNPNKGFGASYRVGVKSAVKKYTTMVHGDNAWGAETLADFFSLLGKEPIVIGYTRDMIKNRTLTRTILSKTFTFIMNTITQYGLIYYNGLQIHPTHTLQEMEIVSRGYAFQPEVLIKSMQKNKKYIQVGMDLTERAKGESKAFRWKNVKEVAASFVYLTKVRWGLLDNC